MPYHREHAVSKSPVPRQPSWDTETTTHEGWLTSQSVVSPRPEVHALAIAWSLAESRRQGQVALLADDAPAQILGRGLPRADDDAPRLQFVRLRPGQIEPCPPLASPGLSRRQIRLQPSSGGVAFERIGRCVVQHNGVPSDRGILRAGDVLTLHNQLVLVCVRRATDVSGIREDETAGFGVADSDGIVGESEAAWRLRADLAHAAASGAHVLVLGESGTGKELAARSVHRRSDRGRRAFVSRSAASIPPGLMDAELFGNRRDYPNAGMPEREGIVGAAQGGTLFLDEIGELGPELQAHLLRLLDADGEYHRLGDSHPRRSDLRLVAATNRPAGALKHDVAARFAVCVKVPGLDARREDIPLIARHLLEEAAATQPDLRARFFEEASDGVPSARLAPDFVEALLRWNWRAHVRELRALLWASIRASRGRYLMVPPEMIETVPASDSEAAIEADGHEPPASAVRAALARHAGNQSKAFSELGLPSRFALYRLMRKHGIDARDERRKR